METQPRRVAFAPGGDWAQGARRRDGHTGVSELLRGRPMPATVAGCSAAAVLGGAGAQEVGEAQQAPPPRFVSPRINCNTQQETFRRRQGKAQTRNWVGREREN